MARKILLADDSVTAQNMGRKILADAGYEVITVNNGSAALKKIAEQKPDLIVLDVYMPGYSGLEVCQRLKETQETSRVPVLLTVGKLEPFKPEEAKRVRADGFIVKPFEASELLSALSKLEDKIVPRGEASKPGRFARATAALEEGRYDKTVAIEEDSGWKNRIAFPPNKKEKAASKENTDPVDFESTNRDLRSVIEHKLADKPHANKSEEDRVDLGALATAGLPKDVTPEEIAALAAAAAQVKGKIAESKFSGAASEEEANSANTSAALPQEVPSATPAPTFTEEKSGEKTEAPVQSSEAAAEASTMALASQSEGIAATIGNPEVGTSAGAGLGEGFSCPAADQPASEPVTMASAGSDGSRWTAVSVGLDPDEAALSLEQEMQKAYAAFAAAESGHTASDIPASESAVGSAELAAATEISTPQEATPSEPAQSIPAMLAPEVAQGLSALAEASTEAIRAAAQELETVAESYIRETPAGHESAPAAEAPVPEASQTAEAIANDSSTPAFGEQQAQASAKHEDSASSHDAKTPEWTNEERKNEEPFAAAAARADDAGQTPANNPELTASTFVNEVPSEQTSSSQVSSDPMSSDMTGSVANPAVGEGGKKDSDAAETTAAAWASWRRIRESGDSKTPSQKTSEFDDVSTPDTAARAVAAGAERTPEEVSAEAGSDPEAIASIVDSVLADLRPKIFEEISRKMGKKK